jgi:hypothetical protein
VSKTWYLYHRGRSTCMLVCAVVPEQLSSMLLPEMSAAQEAMLQAAGIPLQDEAAAAARMQSEQALLTAHNAAVLQLSEEGSCLHQKVRRACGASKTGCTG